MNKTRYVTFSLLLPKHRTSSKKCHLRSCRSKNHGRLSQSVGFPYSLNLASILYLPGEQELDKKVAGTSYLLF